MQAGGLQLARDALHLFQVVEHELLVFALFWFVIGAIDELAVDLVWIWLRLTGRSTTPCLPRSFASGPLDGRLAVFFPTWHEAEVIGATVAHTLSAWPQRELRVFVGCYANDPATFAAARAGAGGDARVRLVVLDRAGPTTKADCLNRLYVAMCEDEADSGGFGYTTQDRRKLRLSSLSDSQGHQGQTSNMGTPFHRRLGKCRRKMPRTRVQPHERSSNWGCDSLQLGRLPRPHAIR